jgi:catechol 2,3-dioxygenase-like lactoylglutathione lyase family enzyme
VSDGRDGPEVRGVLETCLYASNLEEAAEFYERVIGLRAFSRVAGRHVFFSCGRGVFLLFNPEKTSVRGGDVPPHGATGAGHVAFAVPAAELPRWRSSLKGLGVEIEAEVSWPSGGISLYLRDPGGNSVELTTPSIWSLLEDWPGAAEE